MDIPDGTESGDTSKDTCAPTDQAAPSSRHKRSHSFKEYEKEVYKGQQV